MPMFTDLPEHALAWLGQNSAFVCIGEGEMVFQEDQVIEHMDIVLKGSYLIRRKKDGRSKDLGVWKAPYVMGVLPFSRMKSTSAEGLALEDIEMLRVHRDNFIEMVNVSYELVQSLVGIMTDRVRDFQNMRLMDEKLMALGKMSAGLAHELNNPASAMVRSSRELHKHLSQTPEKFKRVITMRVQPEDVDVVNQVLFDRIHHRDDTSDLSLLEREARTDDLEDWFTDHGVDNLDMIDIFLDWDWTTEHLDRVAAVLPSEALGPVLGWIETNLTTESLVDEIQTSSGRIAELVSSIKAYSHMDSDPSMEFTDIHRGIKSTVTMLKFKFKQKNVKLTKDLTDNLPNIKALEGELNQVWTNLLTNALDAAPDDGTGRVTIRTRLDSHHLYVDFEDNGPGVPEDIQSRIFEPFFTTKGIGEGTGMGLDIARRSLSRHDGTIELDSRPGRTVFTVCFPL